jgi:RNA polymerase sigma-70 factor (ECF subfamily)
MTASATEEMLVDRIRRGDSQAWNQLISRYEGRLLAFCQSRLGRREPSEDVVQETFIGFLTSLPNYDRRRPLESYLFSICAHKLTDHLRREGRRPALPLSSAKQPAQDSLPIPAGGRGPSTIVRSKERRGIEDQAIAEAVGSQVERWKKKNDWTKLKCLELLFVRGRANKEVARRLGISEQQVANFKSDFLIQLHRIVRKQGLPADLFPELHGQPGQGL